MATLLAVLLICILNTKAVQINVEVTLPISNISTFTASELWGVNNYNKTENTLSANIVIEEKKFTKILSSTPNPIISYKIISPDVSKVIEAERLRINNTAKWTPTSLPDTFFEEYRPWPQYELFINELLLTHPLITSRIIMGQTVEGRNIEVIAIRGLSGSEPKPGLFIMAAAHAREWLANMATMYIFNELLQGYGQDDTITDILNNVNIFIAPTTNIDGYIYSWSSAPNARMWRKNRRVNGNTGTFGVDLNRNWGPESTWCSTGSSTNPSSDTYCGTAAFSEPEASSAAAFIMDPINNIKGAIDMHTFGELILWPWQYTYDQLPPIYYQQFQDLGDAQEESIRGVHGRTYDSIQGSDLYPHSGGMIDYAWTAGEIYGFTYEGRGPGFAPPASDIIPAGQEQLAGVLTLAQQLY